MLCETLHQETTLCQVSIWKNKKIALSINKKKRCGFICVKCILTSKDHPTFYRTKKQLDEFLKQKLGVVQ